MAHPTDCIIQKPRRRPRAGIALREKETRRASNSRTDKESLTAVSVKPRGSSADTTTCAKVKLATAPIQNLEPPCKQSLFIFPEFVTFRMLVRVGGCDLGYRCNVRWRNDPGSVSASARLQLP